jgi:hypothetical protein
VSAVNLNEHGAVIQEAGRPLPDGTYVNCTSVVLDVRNGIAVSRAQAWCDYEDGSHGMIAPQTWTATETARHSWYPATADLLALWDGGVAA